MCLVNAVDEGTVSRWASQIAGAEKGQEELSDTRRSGLSKTAVTQSCFNLLMNSFELTDVLQPEGLKLSCQYPREV
jgi:hypothetical protein